LKQALAYDNKLISHFYNLGDRSFLTHKVRPDDLGSELAAAAKVSPDTVAKLERGEPLRERTFAAVQTGLETAGVEFIPENGGPDVRLRKRLG
jgi:hypothetical protein